MTSPETKTKGDLAENWRVMLHHGTKSRLSMTPVPNAQMAAQELGKQKVPLA